MVLNEELYRRHIAQDEICLCCSVELESCNHVLFECGEAREVWRSNKHEDIVLAVPTRSFFFEASVVGE